MEEKIEVNYKDEFNRLQHENKKLIEKIEKSHKDYAELADELLRYEKENLQLKRIIKTVQDVTDIIRW